MDLGCIDLGCISPSDEKSTTQSSSSHRIHTVDSTESFSSATKISKNKSPKGSPPSGNALKRVTSQIKKPLHRKSSPINWFPRKKVDSYLKRKIKLLQEAGGMNDTLDETLGHTNPHYCRVLREKMAAKEAACKVMEARKAAMVEASWCRILQAARIPSKEADALLIQAEKEVSEAIEAAKAKGVIMYDTPDRPRKHFEIKTSSTTGKGSTTHTVKASFETAFEVDKQVAAAVKTAFVRLAHRTSCNKEEFRDMLRKISENPDTQEISESDTGSEIEAVAGTLDDSPKSERRSKKKSSPQKFTGPKLVNMMLERLKCLKEEELASLATIVATCGLNAALSEIGSHNMSRDKFETTSIEQFMHGTVKQKQAEPELPSLDKFLVKKMTRLEKEVQEAKNASKAELNKDNDGKNDKSEHVNGTVDSEKDASDNIPDLGSVFIKHSSKLEKEIEEAKRNQRSLDMGVVNKGRGRQQKQEDGEVPSLDKFLVKHVTKLERAVQEAKREREKENVDSNRNGKEVGDKNDGKENSLDQIFVKPLHGLDREKIKSSQEKDSEKWKYIKKQEGKPNENQCESLDKCLIKHVSRLEKAKMDLGTKEFFEVKKKDTVPQLESTVGLEQILVKPPKSRIEKENTVESKSEGGNKYTTISRREARERELLESWGGMGLGSMRPHVSRLQRDKAAWVKAEEEEKHAALQEQ
ncbi:uncharacterized protein LOC141592627 [Silene latifolia]|uniref:uncharacterized protein LOC141592627 n=1 Tax=Silene latifolia TaxID=37657 RepID=UPI003D76D515